MSRTWILAAILAAVLLLPSAAAGSASDPELTDPAGDAATATDCAPPTCLEPPYAPNAAAADMVDITAVWVEEFGPRYAVVVQTVAAPDDATTVSVEFTVEQGPTSVFGSTANGTTITASATGTTLADGAPNNTVVSRVDNTVRFNFTRLDTGVSGGDLLTGLVADAVRQETGTDPLAAGTQTDTDGAPDASAGPSRNFTFVRPDVVAGATLTVVSAAVSETIPKELADGAAVLSDADAANDTVARDRNVTGDTVTTYDGDATVTFTLVLENTGTDVDAYDLNVLDPTLEEVGGVVVDDGKQTQALDVTRVELDPGAIANVTLTVALVDADEKKYATVVEVVSDRNASVNAGVVVEHLALPFAPEDEPAPSPSPSPQPQPVAEREPVAGLGFLTPAAEATGFDEAFGDYAELVLLALLLLLLLVVVFLLLALLRGRWVKVTVTPKTLTARPGETAEFSVEVRNRRKRFRGALASFEQDPGLKAGVLLRNEDGTPMDPLMDEGDERELGLAAKNQDGDTLQGTLRVQLPDDMGEGERGEVTLNVVPIADDGHSKPRKGGHVRVRVVTEGSGAGPTGGAGKPAKGVPVRLSEVRHDPESPQAGDVVTTTASLANDGDDETLRLRVVLQLDGEDADEETVEVPPRSARAVVFRWLADEGSNRVRVQVYPAE